MFPLIAHAATLDEFLVKFNDKIINPVIELAFIVAFVVFIWGVFQLIRGANSDDARKKGKEHILWGIVGFLIMFGVWGIINLLVNTFGIKGASINQREQKFDPPPIQELQIR
ncbi:hypothetical protein IT401_00465 [Candidatus Nomurabacteria bacterium]|nr:hypothetical protein [Candidatus Nomurabacteria bacterium]